MQGRGDQPVGHIGIMEKKQMGKTMNTEDVFEISWSRVLSSWNMEPAKRSNVRQYQVEQHR